jgi:hypothetical protein
MQSRWAASGNRAIGKFCRARGEIDRASDAIDHIELALFQ